MHQAGLIRYGSHPAALGVMAVAGGTRPIPPALQGYMEDTAR